MQLILELPSSVGLLRSRARTYSSAAPVATLSDLCTSGQAMPYASRSKFVSPASIRAPCNPGRPLLKGIAAVSAVWPTAARRHRDQCYISIGPGDRAKDLPPSPVRLYVAYANLEIPFVFVTDADEDRPAVTVIVSGSFADPGAVAAFSRCWTALSVWLRLVACQAPWQSHRRGPKGVATSWSGQPFTRQFPPHDEQVER